MSSRKDSEQCTVDSDQFTVTDIEGSLASEGASSDPRVHSFRDLQVWQKAIQLTVAIYKVTQTFPREELYGLTSQIRQSAVSIPSNMQKDKDG